MDQNKDNNWLTVYDGSTNPTTRSCEILKLEATVQSAPPDARTPLSPLGQARIRDGTAEPAGRSEEILFIFSVPLSNIID